MISSQNQDSGVVLSSAITTAAAAAAEKVRSGRAQENNVPLTNSVALVPISVFGLQQRAEDGTCNKTTIESIAWSFIEQTSGKCLLKRSLAIDGNNLTLGQAIKQVIFERFRARHDSLQCTTLILIRGPLSHQPQL